jgi:osmotically-inducible protein OsmY
MPAMTVLLAVSLIAHLAVARALSDSGIQEAIARHIVMETVLAPEVIDIAVKDGIVILSGTVNNLLQKSQVRQIAESIRGVRSVVDTVAVRPVVRDSAEIARDVRRSLAQLPPGSGLTVSVAANGGKVTLTGQADSWVLSGMAVQTVMGVNGVSEVVDQIDVKARLDRDDADVAQDIRHRLAADLYLDAAQIEVTVADGRVALAGTVGTAAEKRRASESAWMSGVERVDDRQLEVDWRETDRLRRESPYEPRSDDAILTAVREALQMDPRVNTANPQVTVENGVVTLIGAVDTLYAKQVAEEDARSTTGVWRVQNQLQLRYRAVPPADEVAALIEDVFKRDAELHTADIKVVVDQHHVRLSGSVATMGQKLRAGNIASRMEGVLTLENQITVAARSERRTDPQIRDAIEEELFWSPYVDGERITVMVSDGEAVLKGSATGRFVAHMAVQNAFEGGARTVNTELILNDGSIYNEHFTGADYRFRSKGLFRFRP